MELIGSDAGNVAEAHIRSGISGIGNNAVAGWMPRKAVSDG